MSKAKSKQKVVEPVSDEEDDGCDEGSYLPCIFGCAVCLQTLLNSVLN
jgi:hypothetical protein